MFEFKITRKDRKSAARTGVFYTPHGSFRTPVFMPVGTYGAVKTLTPAEVQKCGAEIILGNTFHLEERPSSGLIKRFGGLHKFMNWDGPILTDSGGFQVFSLAKMRKISDRGVEFRSPIDGSKRFLTPRKVLEIQQKLGSDIVMQLDECAPADASRQVAERALDRTMKWAEESLDPGGRPGGSTRGVEQALFPIVQGVNFPDLRRKSAEFCAGLPTPGVAIGGLAVGESKSDFFKTLDLVSPILPTSKPRYLMGVGEFTDILEAVERGIDMFDCVIPTRLARHGSFFGKSGKRENIRNARFRNDKKPLIAGCKCECCQNFSRGYLRHLFVTNEVLGLRMLTIHNLSFMFEFMRGIRKAIREGRFGEFKRFYGSGGLRHT
jgi:queuine tRNA-ribosyltransferase